MRNGILSVIYWERFSHFELFSHYNTTQDSAHAIYYRNGKKIFERYFKLPINRFPKTSIH